MPVPDESYPRISEELKRAPVDTVVAPLHRFMRLETSAGVVLLACAAIALFWANGPWKQSYERIWHTWLTLGVSDRGVVADLGYNFVDKVEREPHVVGGPTTPGSERGGGGGGGGGEEGGGPARGASAEEAAPPRDPGWKYAISLPVVGWINDALMAAFFFVVGMEIKREALVGALSSVKKAALPVVAALGGMAVPAGVYALINSGGGGQLRGWGVPMATDIAFALGVLALVGSRVPASLRVFLVTLAIADDIGALLVIAIFYTGQLHFVSLGVAGVMAALMCAMNLLGVRRPIPYAIVGFFLWVFVLQSGVHATIAGVVGAMMIPVRAHVDTNQFVAFMRRAINDFEREGPAVPIRARGIILRSHQQVIARSLEHACEQVQTPLQRLEHFMAPWIIFGVVPLFALANAGASIDAVRGDPASILTDRVALGIVAGLVIGKPLGVFFFTWAATKLGLGALPAGVTWRHIHGVSWLAGIGFTMALFIAALAFGQSETLETAKLAVLAGSVIAGAVGVTVLLTGRDRGTAGRSGKVAE